MNDKSQKRLCAWGWVNALVLLIYSTLYIVRPICEWLRSQIPLTLIVNSLIVLSLCILIVIFIKKVSCKTLQTYIVLAFVLFGYGVGMFVIRIPEEKLHFLEYGLCSFLVYRALRIDFSKMKSFVFAFILTCLIGLGDEVIQGLLPNRYYQHQDVLLNCVSALLGLLFVELFDEKVS